MVLPGYTYHVVQRGNNRQVCYFADDDYQFYQECMMLAGKKYRCDIHAYVLMTNHVHLLVTPRVEEGLSRFMQSIGRRYVRYVNDIYKRTGTLWEGRYKSSVIDTDRYLLTCYRYIELNPVRAGITQRPSEYQWSSARWHGLGERNKIIKDHPLYVALGVTSDERQARYRELFRHCEGEPRSTEVRIGNRSDLS